MLRTQSALRNPDKRRTSVLVAQAASSPSYGSWATPYALTLNWRPVSGKYQVLYTYELHPAPATRAPNSSPPKVSTPWPCAATHEYLRGHLPGLSLGPLAAVEKPLRVLFKTPTCLNGPTTDPLIYRIRRPVRPAAWPTPPTARPLQSRGRTSRLPGASRRT